MHTNFAFARRLKWATGWMAVFAFTAACGSAAKTDHGDDDTAGVTTDAPLDGVAGDETLPTDGAAQNDTQSGPQLVIDNPKANATLGGAGARAESTQERRAIRCEGGRCGECLRCGDGHGGRPGQAVRSGRQSGELVGGQLRAAGLGAGRATASRRLRQAAASPRAPPKKGEVWVVAVTPADSYGKGTCR